MAGSLKLSNQNVVITGVASGIGATQASLFLENGAQVWGCDIQETGLVQKLSAKYPERFFFAHCDVRSGKALKEFAHQALVSMKRVDILLNTAGILDGYKPSLETSEAQWDDVMDTNLKSMFRLTNHLLPSMLEHNHGVIVNMASIAGIVAGGGGAVYTAAKHAIVGYTKQLDYDYASHGIRANCIAPGAIKTPMNKADFAGDAAMAKKVAQETPASRWAKPEEVADLTLFLASAKADYIHGAVIPIDGGWIEK